MQEVIALITVLQAVHELHDADEPTAQWIELSCAARALSVCLSTLPCIPPSDEQLGLDALSYSMFRSLRYQPVHPLFSMRVASAPYSDAHLSLLASPSMNTSRTPLLSPTMACPPRWSESRDHRLIVSVPDLHCHGTYSWLYKGETPRLRVHYSLAG